MQSTEPWRECEARLGFSGVCYTRGDEWFVQEVPAEPDAYSWILLDAAGNESRRDGGLGHMGPRALAAADEFIASMTGDERLKRGK